MKYQLNEDEIKEFIKRIGKPTYKFFIKTIERELSRNNYDKIEVNSLITIVCVILATINRNSIDWVSTLVQDNINKPVNYKSVCDYLIEQIQMQLESKIGNH